MHPGSQATFYLLLRHALDDLAQRTGRSKSFYVRTALHEYLAELEDAFDADAAIDAFEKGGRRSRPLSQLKAATQH